MCTTRPLRSSAVFFSGAMAAGDSRLMALVRAIVARRHRRRLCGYLPRRQDWRPRMPRTVRRVRQRRRTSWTRSGSRCTRATRRSTSPPLPTDGDRAKLIGMGGDVRARNRRGAEPLHYAADGGPGSRAWNPAAQAATVTSLIQAGADPNAVDKSGVTPLHRAVRTRCASAVRALLDGGADGRRKNKNGSTPMRLATRTTGRGGSGSPESKAQQVEIVRLAFTNPKCSRPAVRGQLVEDVGTNLGRIAVPLVLPVAVDLPVRPASWRLWAEHQS